MVPNSIPVALQTDTQIHVIHSPCTQHIGAYFPGMKKKVAYKIFWEVQVFLFLQQYPMVNLIKCLLKVSIYRVHLFAFIKATKNKLCEL